MTDSWLEDLAERIEQATDYLGPTLVVRDVRILDSAVEILRHWTKRGAEREDEVRSLVSAP